MPGAKNRAGLHVRVYVCWDVGLGAVARCKVHGGSVARCKELSQPFQMGYRPQCQAVTLVYRLHTKDYDIKVGKKVL